MHVDNLDYSTLILLLLKYYFVPTNIIEGNESFQFDKYKVLWETTMYIDGNFN